MRAVHLEDGVVSLRDAAKPPRGPGMALVRVLVAGVCNTDLELQRGYYGFTGTPGHEFVGEVEAADTPALVGKRVVGEINLACGECDWCRKGLGRHCPGRTVLGIVKHPGAFADYLTLPERNLYVLPEGLPSERAVFAEPLAAACEILEQAPIPSCAPVAVLGDGKLGLLAALVLNAHGYGVRLFGRHEEKLRIAARARIETVLRGDPPAAARALVGGSARDSLDLQLLDLVAVAVAVEPRESGVDHVADAGDGERGFRDVRREHDAPRAARMKNALLFLERKPRVEREDFGAARSVLAQRVSGVTDLALAGQEDQHVAA